MSYDKCGVLIDRCFVDNAYILKQMSYLQTNLNVPNLSYLQSKIGLFLKLVGEIISQAKKHCQWPFCNILSKVHMILQ